MLVACFDIGGTAIKAALINGHQKIVKRFEIKTPKTRKALLTWMDEIISSDKGVTAISLSVPGSVNYKTGIIGGQSAISYIHRRSWYKLLEHHHLPIYMENDANCVGLSQLAHQKNIQNFACVVCGTGIGGALIIDQKLVRGKKTYGGEFGYMIIGGLSNPLQNWSQRASTGSLVRRVVKKLPKEKKRWTGKTIFEAAENGHAICQQAIDEMTQEFAIGLLNIYYFFDPEKIFIGGAISQNPHFIKKVREQLAALLKTFPEFPEAPVIAACHYHKDANVMGAYINALQGESHD